MQSRPGGLLRWRLSRSLPALLWAFGGLLVLVAVLGFIFARQIITSSQDTRTQATNPAGRVDVVLSARSTELELGQELLVSGTINTHGVGTDGVQLVLTVPKIAVARPTVNLVDDTGLQVVLNQVVDRGDVWELQFLAVPATIGQAFTTTTPVRFLEIRAITTRGGSYTLAADQVRCLVTLHGSDPVIDELKPIAPVTFHIATDPATTPIPTITSSPSTSPSPKTSPSPQTTPSTSITPSTSRAPSLVMAYTLQGLTTAAVPIKTTVYLQAENPILDAPVPAEIHTFEALFLSGADGTLKTDRPILLLDLPVLTTGTSYNVYVKTSNSLRKFLGNMVIKPGANVAPTAWISKPILVGDFVQTPEAEWNRINLLDVGAALAQYTQLQTPVTSDNQEFDVTHDQIIDIMDIGLILSNYTQLVVSGD